MTSKGLAARWSSVTGRMHSGYAVPPTPLRPRSRGRLIHHPAIRLSPHRYVFVSRKEPSDRVHLLRWSPQDAESCRSTFMWMLIEARPCTLSSSPELKDLSWLSSSPSPPPLSAPSVRHAPPPGAATDQTGPIYRVYRSVPPHSTAVNPVRAGAGTSFCSGTAV